MDVLNNEKRQKRLARNKESARKSRNRKKHYQEFLENKVKMLTQEANSLRQQLYTKTEDLEMTPSQELDIKSKIDTISEKLLSACNQRKEHIRFIIEEVIDVMIPSHAKLLILACQNPNIECPELSNEQLNYIKELQPVIVQEQCKLKEVVTELRKVRNEFDGMLDWASELPQELMKFLSMDKVTELLNSENPNNGFNS